MTLNGTFPYFILGDFNTAPGHFAYHYLVNNQTLIQDAYDNCINQENINQALTLLSSNSRTSFSCSTKPYLLSSYHHYYGIEVNRYYWNFILYTLFTLHGRGITPYWNRYHIDWILYQYLKTKSFLLIPRFVSIVKENWDITGGPYGSDHFPIFGEFLIMNRKSL